MLESVLSLSESCFSLLLLFPADLAIFTEIVLWYHSCQISDAYFLAKYTTVTAHSLTQPIILSAETTCHSKTLFPLSYATLSVSITAEDEH